MGLIEYMQIDGRIAVYCRREVHPNVKAAPQLDLLRVTTPFACDAVLSAGDTSVAFISLGERILHLGHLMIAGDRNLIDSVDWQPDVE